MKTEHTPAPWKSHKYPTTSGGYGFSIQAGGSITIANLSPGTTTDRIEPIAEANARLIAASPELLKELVFAADILRAIVGNAVQVQRMDAVISKATGAA